ncbi:MAG: phosphotransferase [Candidatus Falkowbacteria bacterium]|nr:phosphotransferase [Candidatus Falkowbacteria bacterium]
MQAVLENYQTKNKRLHVFDLTATKKYFRAQKNNILKSNFLNKRPFVAALEKELFSLKFPATLPKGMIHEDLGRRHVLWQKDRIDAIIDFDRSYFGYLLFDLGQAGRAWGFKNNWHSFDRVGLARLLRGYQTERKLTKLEKELLPDAIKFAILERALSFCTRYLNFSKDPKDQAFAWNSVFKQLPLIDKNRGFIIETLK